MAAGIMRQLYDEMSLQGRIESAGTADWNIGRMADQRAITVAKKNGLDLSGHRARQVRPGDFFEFNSILCMDRKNMHELGKLLPANKIAQVRLLSEHEIIDPYYSGESAFHELYNSLDRILRQFIIDEVIDRNAR